MSVSAYAIFYNLRVAFFFKGESCDLITDTCLYACTYMNIQKEVFKNIKYRFKALVAECLKWWHSSGMYRERHSIALLAVM